MFFDKSSKTKLAFTMSEMLIVISIIGVIALATIPVMKRALPSKEEEMHKKMSYLIEEIVNHMYDNEAYYARTTDIAKFGFLNTDEVTIDGVKYGGTTDTARKEKFCRLFASQFNTITNNSNITCPATLDSGTPSFRTTDGVDWWIPQTTFKEDTNGQVKGFVKIKVDVNGKDEGNNCTEGSQDCRKPDIFYYYIKANGSVTLSDPTIIEARTYQIIPDIVTKDTDGNVISEQGGVLEIAKVSSDNTIGTYSSSADDFDNLEANTSYMLRAKPNENYISNWATKSTEVAAEKRYGYRKVRTTKVKTNVQLEFRQIKKFCIKLKVVCPASDISDCTSTRQYRYNCSYVNKGEGNGDFKKVSEFLDNYDYVGPYQGSYAFECPAGSTGALSIGSGDDVGYLYACGLQSGEYQLYVEPADGMFIHPHVDDNTFTQNVRLGTEDIRDLVVEIRNSN